MRPQALTVIARVKAGKEECLRGLLCQHGKRVYERSRLTHFANWVILNDPDNGPRLLWSSNYDGTVREYLRDLLSGARDLLDEILRMVEGYRGPERLEAFVKSHSYSPQTFFIAYQKLTCARTLELMHVREQIERFADAATCTGMLDADGINGFLDTLDSLSGPPPPTPWLPAILHALASIAHDEFFGAILWLARRYGALLVDDKFRSVASAIGQKLDGQDVTDQDQMTNMIDVRPELLWRLRFGLWLMNFIGRYGCPPGDLVGVRTIHFARWVLVDGGKRMLFQSKFDGSWENYMGDFVDKVAWGLDGIWSNTKGYPSAGMRDIDAFKRFIRERQFEPLATYNAYPDETVQNIERDDAIVGSLTAHFDRRVVADWLERL
jgi:hypothetical protein